MTEKRNKRVLVAGGAGFVGSHLCEKLVGDNCEVTVIDSCVTGQVINLSKIENQLRLFKHNIIDPLPEMGDFEEIYNLASPASPVDFAKLPLFILETASVGHRRLLDLAKRSNARILFASTSEIYGDAEVHPQPESYFGNVNTIGPRGCYDEAKRYGEALSYAYFRQDKVQIRIARIFNTYGPRMRLDDGRIIPNFFTQALQKEALSIYGDGSQTRSFCFVEDLVDGLCALMQSNETRPVNLGNPIERSVLQIGEEINRLTGNTAGFTHLPRPENDPLQRRPEISRAHSVLHWQPKVGLQEGLQKTLIFFREALLKSGPVITPTL